MAQRAMYALPVPVGPTRSTASRKVHKRLAFDQP